MINLHSLYKMEKVLIFNFLLLIPAILYAGGRTDNITANNFNVSTGTVKNGTNDSFIMIESTNSGTVPLIRFKNSAGVTHKIGVETDSDSGGGGFPGSGSSFNIVTESTHPIVFSTNGNKYLTLSQTGDLTLSVAGNPRIVVTDTGTSGTSGIYLISHNNADGATIRDNNKVFEIYPAGGTLSFRISSAGEINQANQPSFLVTQSGVSNVTGSGTIYTVVWPTEITDQGGDFSSNTFTAPVSGQYLLTVNLYVTGVLSTHTARRVQIVTSNRTYHNISNHLLAEEFSGPLSVVADMDAGDTAIIKLSLDGSTEVVDLDASLFSGSLIN